MRAFYVVLLFSIGTVASPVASFAEPSSEAVISNDNRGEGHEARIDRGYCVWRSALGCFETWQFIARRPNAPDVRLVTIEIL